jgi:hypothetical protein
LELKVLIGPNKRVGPGLMWKLHSRRDLFDARRLVAEGQGVSFAIKLKKGIKAVGGHSAI